jgi:DNA-binding transcriptional ArsR family regulator
MVQYIQAGFDASFAALSDATRRGVLEQVGLVTTEKVGRVRTCRLGLRRLKEEAAWIESYRQFWDARFDELDKVVEELKRKEKADGRNNRE